MRSIALILFVLSLCDIPDSPVARRFETFLDGPHQVIIESAPTLVVSFDFGRFADTTQAAIMASLGSDEPLDCSGS